MQMKKLEVAESLVSNMHKTLSLFDYIDPKIFGSWFTVFFLLIAAEPMLERRRSRWR